VFGPKGMAEYSFDLERDPTRHDWAALGDSATTGRAAKWLKEHGIDGHRIVYRVNTMLGLAEAVASGVGLALLPCFIGHAVPTLVQLSPPIPEIQGELWLLTHPDLRNTARVRAFLDFCAAGFENCRDIIEGGIPPERRPYRTSC
jgi:DNA-binding transcriptional LysR family regulator